MIVLMSFSPEERERIVATAEALRLEKRCKFFDALDDLYEYCAVIRKAGDPIYFPRVIVMSLDAPKERWQADLKHLKSTPSWASIPVIGFGALDDRNDIPSFYSLGGASCIRRDETQEAMIATWRMTMNYWLTMPTMPCDYLVSA